MAVITKNQILKRVEKGEIAFKPTLDTFQLHAHSVDLRLGYTFLVPKMWRITKEGRRAIDPEPFDEDRPSYFDIVELEEGQSFDLLPNEYVLVSTLETIKVPNDLMAVLYPRSSVNRKGLSVDLTGIVDAGYEGQLTIPIRNNTQAQTIRIYPGERFCQVVFEELTETVVPRKSRYHQKDIIEAGDKQPSKEIAMIKHGEIKRLKDEFGVA